MATGALRPELPTEQEAPLVTHASGRQPGDMETYPEPPQLPLVLACNGPPPLMRNPVRVAHGLYTDLSTRGAEPWKAAQQLSLARCAAACMQTPSALALSHESAALVHGLWVYRHEPDISLVMPFHPRRSRMPLPPVPGGRGRVFLRRRRLRLERKNITAVSGLPVTTVLRTAMDCAFDLPAREAICVVDSAVRSLARPSRCHHEDSEQRMDEVRRRLEQIVVAQGPRRGARRARAVLRITSGLAESPGESVLHWFVRALGLPAPRLQARIADPEHSQFYFPDEAWPEFKVLAEFDGRLKYTSPEYLWKEKRRHDALVRMGWRTERFIWSDFGDLGALRHRVLTLFPPAAARLWRPVADLWK